MKVQTYLKNVFTKIMCAFGDFDENILRKNLVVKIFFNVFFVNFSSEFSIFLILFSERTAPEY